ncbi:MAG TPA: exodeoxyribonuclease VII large subunit, partial [Edaphobacter sp.]|nr:exodeoxyribonuclease VII large subunit [Edaphobacter sp.]
LRLESAATRRLRTPARRLDLLTDRLNRQNIAVRIATTRHRLQQANQRLQRVSTQTIATRQTRLNRATAHLEAISPLAVLSRGYALIYLENDAQNGPAAPTLLKSSSDAVPGQTIRARLAKGAIAAKITETSNS